jgi:hypothetical protein
MVLIALDTNLLTGICLWIEDPELALAFRFEYIMKYNGNICKIQGVLFLSQKDFIIQ